MQPSLADRPHRARFAIAAASIAAVVSLFIAIRPHSHHGRNHDGHQLSGRCHYHARY